MPEPYRPPFSLFGDPVTPMYGTDPGQQYRGPFDLQTQNPMINMAGQMVIPLLMQQFLGTKSGKTWGQFSPSQNLYDQMAAKHYFEQQQVAMNAAALRDQASYQATIQGGMMLATGKPLSLAQEQQAYGMSKQVADMTPMLAQILGPDFVDMLHGSRGSSVVLSQALHRSLQTARDSVTGAIGASGDTAGMIANEIYSRHFGTNADLSEMKGLSAGQAGLLFEQMQQRGLMPPGGGQLGVQERYASVAKMALSKEQVARLAENDADIQRIRKSGRTPTQHDYDEAETRIRTTKSTIDADVAKGGPIDAAKLAELPGTSDMLRSSDAQRYADRLKNMAGAITAMRDIFGDMGRPNAPMRELINGLEALTQGGLATMSPAELERIARSTHVLAKQTGVSMQAILGLTAQGAEQGKRLGLDPVFAIQSTQAAIAYGAAARDTQRLDRPVYGALSMEQLTLYDQQLRQNAVGSQTGNQIMATARMAEAGYFKDPNSRSAKMAAALQTGKVTYEHEGATHSAIMTPSEWRAMLQADGVAVGDADAFLADTAGNQRLGSENWQLARAARRAQRNTDIRPRIAQAIGFGNFRQIMESSGITDQLRGMDLNSVEIAEASRRMGIDVAEGFLNLTAEEATTPELRKAAMARNFKQTLTDVTIKRSEEQGLDEAATAARVAEMHKKLETRDANGLRPLDRMAMTAEADISTTATRMGTSTHGLWQLHSNVTEEAAAARQRDIDATVLLQTATAGIATAGPMRRLVDSLQSGKRMTVEDFASNLIGGIDFSEMSKDDPQFKAFTEAITRANDPALRDAKGLTAEGWETKQRMAKIITAVIGGDGGNQASIQLDALQKRYGVTNVAELEAEIVKRRDTITGDDPDAYDRISSLDFDLGLIPAYEKAQKGHSLARSLKDAKISTGTMIDADYLRQVVNSGVSVDSLREEAAKEKDIDKRAELQGQAERAGTSFMEEARSRLEALDLSPVDLEELGSGAVNRVYASRQKAAALQLYADNAKLDIGKLLAGTAGTKEQQAEAQKQAAAIRGDINWIVEQKTKGAAPVTPMLPAEKQAAEDIGAWRRGLRSRYTGDKFSQTDQEAEGGVASLLQTLPAETSKGIDRKRLQEEVARTGRGEGYYRIARSREELLKMADTSASAPLDVQEKAIAELRKQKLTPEKEARLQQLDQDLAPLRKIWERMDKETDAFRHINDTLNKVLPTGPTSQAGQDRKVAVAATGTLELVGLDKVLMKMQMPDFNLDHMNITHPQHPGPALHS